MAVCVGVSGAGVIEKNSENGRIIRFTNGRKIAILSSVRDALWHMFIVKHNVR